MRPLHHACLHSSPINRYLMPALLATSLAAGLSSSVSAGVFEDVGGVVKDVGRAADSVVNDVGGAIVDGAEAYYGTIINEAIVKPLMPPFGYAPSPPPTPPPAPVPPGYARGKDGQLIPYGTPLPPIGKRPSTSIPLGSTSPLGKAIGVNRDPLRTGGLAPVPPSAPLPPVAKPLPAPVQDGPKPTRVFTGRFGLEPGDSIVLEHKGPGDRGPCLSHPRTRDCKPAKRGEPWQAQQGPWAKRGESWQPKQGPWAKRGESWQPKHGPWAKRGEQSQATRGAWAGLREARRAEKRERVRDIIRSLSASRFGR